MMTAPFMHVGAESVSMAPLTITFPLTRAFVDWSFGKTEVSPPTFRNTRKSGAIGEADPSE